jgi:mutual gliding-motility protein MglA
MSFVNFAKREINFKIVYYGPPLCGKTTNLEALHEVMPDDARGAMTMLSTRQDRTLYFDFLPLKSNAIKGFVSRFQLYTVPGQSIYNETRKLVLTAADGIVFVADSQWDEMEHNAESLENLQENLKGHRRRLGDIPCLLQFNKRDLPGIAPVEFMDFMLNQQEEKMLFFESSASQGFGVHETLNMICKMVMAQFVREHNMGGSEIPDEKNLAVASADATENS